MVAQEMAVDYPERVGDLILVSTTPGWPFAYPMPAVSAALIARTGSLTREVAARSHAEKALSARTVLDRPEMADRLVALQGTRPADPGAAGRPGGRWCWLHRPSTANAHPRTHAGLARICGHRGRSGQRQAARGPHPVAQLVIFPELGHLLFWEDPDGFVDAVTSFLLADRVPRSVLYAGRRKH
jgi:pimeloyl-ACP methyl ester carboxylesterase